MSDDLDKLFGTLRRSRFGGDPNDVIQSAGTGSGNIQPLGGFIADGVVVATNFDTTPPAVPTGLALSSDVAFNSDGGSFVRLLVGLVQPADADLFGSHVEVTSHNDGADPPSPVWDRPASLFIPNGETQARIDDVQGVTQFWARARAQDVLSNFSAWTSTVTHTTIGDNVAPPIPQGITLVPGFRGFGASWSGSAVQDLAFYEMRWAIDSTNAGPDDTPVGPDTDQWVFGKTKAQVAFIGDLTPDRWHWFQVRAVDTSNNVQTSAADSTAVSYLGFPEAGWSDQGSVLPTLIGATDIATNSITSNMIQTGALSADKIEGGTLRINTGASAAAAGIQIVNADGEPLAQWDENGLLIYEEAGSTRLISLTGGALKFSTDGGASFSTAVTADGIDATAIRFGAQVGGANIIRNSNFELSTFVLTPTTAVFTDTAGTPGWKAANRTTAPENMTEGTSLTQTTVTV